MSRKTNDLMIMPALSNNSHELFHSNLWAWLIDNTDLNKDIPILTCEIVMIML